MKNYYKIWEEKQIELNEAEKNLVEEAKRINSILKIDEKYKWEKVEEVIDWSKDEIIFRWKDCHCGDVWCNDCSFKKEWFEVEDLESLKRKMDEEKRLEVEKKEKERLEEELKRKYKLEKFEYSEYIRLKGKYEN